MLDIVVFKSACALIYCAVLPVMVRVHTYFLGPFSGKVESSSKLVPMPSTVRYRCRYWPV